MWYSGGRPECANCFGLRPSASRPSFPSSECNPPSAFTIRVRPFSPSIAETSRSPIAAFIDRRSQLSIHLPLSHLFFFSQSRAFSPAAMPPNALLLSVQTNHRRTRSSSQDGSEAGSGRVASPRLMTPPLCTPPLQMGGQAGFNPHSRLLRRSSSCSTLGSIVDSDDGRAGEDRPLATEAEAEAEWTRTDIERLKSVRSFVVPPSVDLPG